MEMDFADFESYDPSLFADDFNVWEEEQVFLDNEGADEVVEADDVAGFEDDGFETGLGLD